MAEGRGWYSRGYLPHIDVPGVHQFITWRLADAVPQESINQWAAELKDEPDEDRKRKLARQIEAYSDLGFGSCCLREPKVAELVEKVLLHDHGKRYELDAWVVMPNHVHVILIPNEEQPLDNIVKLIKGASARRINQFLGRSGQLWQPDYFDRIIRDEAHYGRVRSYIEWNPVKAGLCNHPTHWHNTSASRSEA